MFLLVPAYPGCPGQTAVKWLLLLLWRGLQRKKGPLNGCVCVGIAEFGFAKIKDPDINLHVTLPTFTAPN